jgi:hypothetical protein
MHSSAQNMAHLEKIVPARLMLRKTVQQVECANYDGENVLVLVAGGWRNQVRIEDRPLRLLLAPCTSRVEGHEGPNVGR